MAKGKIPKRPTWDEFVLEELTYQINEALHEKSEVLLTIWAWEEQLRGQIVHLDSRTGKIHINKGNETVKVSFLDIMSLDYPRD
ncbi:YolD-like family protein [Paenibacillus sp. GD4]|uniref:YolD-like family protein n=1 Tax=Paenibacillus sp. GD4 TaxID=3068890 RepID=UPI002796BD8A|nr:YolD-like family protein [Paenibacillus sp. GD4]MDQ1913825.1 YolD-like family protein [Paenibacillus sp. GD4]